MESSITEEDKHNITFNYFEAINTCNIELFRIFKEHPEEVRPIYPIVAFVIDRLTTVTSLVTSGTLWDAEIVLRSALETFLKLLFITTADEVEQKLRLNEFWNDLAEINILKQSEQLKKNLTHLGSSETHYLAYTPNILSEKDEAQIRAKWNRVSRQKLEQKWSFSQIVASLSQNYKGHKAEIVSTLGHSYRMASHVAHGDETGILIIEERNSRSQKEQDITNFAHYLRLLSDSFDFCCQSAIATMDFLKKDPKFFNDLSSSLKETRDLVTGYIAKVYDDPLYAPYREKFKK